MKELVYLVCDAHRVVKMTKSKPTVTGGQIAVPMMVTVPHQWFSRATPATVNLEVPAPEKYVDGEVGIEIKAPLEADRE